MSKIHEDYFDRKSQDYEDYIALLVGYDDALKIIEELSDLRPTHIVVDIGTGAGKLAFMLASKVGKVVGVDISAGMLEKARAETERKNVTNVEFIKACCTRLPIVDAFADLVASNLVLHHLTDSEKLCAAMEFCRVIKPGGKVVIGDLLRHGEGLSEMLRSIAQRYEKVHGSERTIDVLLKTIEKMYMVPEYPASVQTWREILSSTGFVDFQATQVRGPLWVISATKTNR